MFHGGEGENCCAKALRQAHAWCVEGTARGPKWLEQSEREREGGGEDREGTGLVVPGFVSPREVGTLEGCEQRRG